MTNVNNFSTEEGQLLNGKEKMDSLLYLNVWLMLLADKNVHPIEGNPDNHAMHGLFDKSVR